MRSSSWGSLVAQATLSLATGCSLPTRAEPPAATPPQTSRLGPLTPAVPAVLQDASTIQAEQVLLRFGQGQFAYTTYLLASRQDLCPTRGAGPACGQFRVAAGPLLPAPRSWDQFSPGGEVVYARGYQQPAIDRIDGRGQVTEFLRDQRLAVPTVFVLEAGAAVYVLAGGTDEKASGTLYEVQTDAKGAKLGASVELPMAPIPWWSYHAAGARAVEQQKLAPLHGAPAAVPLPDAKNKDTWAMVWVEALPSPLRWPPGRPYKRPGRRPLKAKNACSTENRPLTDPAVEKRIHITRFKGLKLQDDQIAASSATLDPRNEFLVASAAPKGVTVNGVTYGRFGVLSKAPPKTAPPPPPPRYQSMIDERVQSASFDEKKRRGSLVVASGERCWRRAFDADGVFLEDAAPVPCAERDPAGPSPGAPVLPVWGDRVELTLRSERLGARWLGAGKELRTFETILWPAGDRRDLPALLSGGPLLRLPDGSLELIPARPGPPVPVEPSPDKNSVACPRSFYTSATTVLLACSEAVDQERPGIVAGLRRLDLRGGR